ncbi:MAG: hypothetical protein QM710_08015 [Flavobacterium sp.]
MKTRFFIIWIVLHCFSSFGQTCTYKNLSKSFDFKTHIQRISRKNEITDTCLVTVTITRKDNAKSIQTIHFGSSYFFRNVYKDCLQVRSYSTGVNNEAAANDSDYGSLIVADFNFDGKEDLALKDDSGGNSGPTYDYYIQNEKGKFVKDTYLSDRMDFFPSSINKKNKTLTTIVFIGGGNSKMVYQYTAQKKSWKRIEHTIIR